ncbi:hypothetical protein BOX15_Mlig025417g1, partial [Macrostomum lignano]
ASSKAKLLCIQMPEPKKSKSRGKAAKSGGPAVLSVSCEQQAASSGTNPAATAKAADKEETVPLRSNPPPDGASTAINMPTDNDLKSSYNSLKGKEMFLRLQGKTPLTLEFKNLSYYVRVRNAQKTILDSLNGKFKPGRLVALMGPSGAGKSSLTNVLAGYISKNVEGDILVNGQIRNLRKFRKNSCYIMQEDLLLPHLSVYESMTCSANLRLCEPAEKKEAMVRTILDVLGLAECSSTRASSLSGGQKKRLAIAQELLSNPPIMFFDEPTSGLDSASCFQCVSLLKELALGGRTIVCTIHQPSAKLFEMFDQLYFVAKGRCLYNGPAGAVVPYLASRGFVCPSYHNPTDYFMEAVCGDDSTTPVGDAGEDSATTDGDQQKGECMVSALAEAVRSGQCAEFMRAYKSAVAKEKADAAILADNASATSSSSSSANSNKNPDQSLANNDSDSNANESSVKDDSRTGHFSTGTLNQFRVLYVRTFLSIIRDTQLTRLRLLSHVSVGLLIGMLYFKIGNDGLKVQSNAGCLFFCMLFLMFTALMPTVLTFPMEMNIFLREHLNYWYSVKAYYLAKTLADLPFQVIFPVIYGTIVYFMTAQPLEFMRYFLFLTICVQTSLVAQSFGLLIGAATNLESAIFLGPVTAIPILLFSGFFVTFSTIPVYLQWLSYCSYVRYAFEAVLQIIYGMNRNHLECNPDASADSSESLAPCLSDPDFFLKFFSADGAKIYVDFIVLCMFFVILRGLCFLILKFRTRASR